MNRLGTKGSMTIGDALNQGRELLRKQKWAEAFATLTTPDLTAALGPTDLEGTHIPWPIDSMISRFFLVRLVRFFGHHILTVKTPLGRKLRPKLLATSTPLIRVKPKDLINAGVEPAPRVVGVRNGQPLLADDRTLDVRNVIWCTGYEHGFPWIDLPIAGESGEPMHERGVVANVPGLYFVGLHFLYSMTSATLIGVGRDAARVVKTIELRTRSAREPEKKLRPVKAA